MCMPRYPIRLSLVTDMGRLIILPIMQLEIKRRLFMLRAEQLAVYFVMGTVDCKGEEKPLEVLEDALAAGVTIFQLREKGRGALQGEQLEQFARQCQALCQRYVGPFSISDKIELLRKLTA